MTGNEAAWVAAVEEQLHRVAGDWVDELAARWAGHAAATLVRVTVHGAYDAGKSSLLKRFLIEDGTPVPDWLRVGGAPTSDTAEEIDSGDLTWVDTPGTGGGNDRHDALARAPLSLTDALVVVLSPQMLSGDDRVVRGIVDGTFYAPETKRPLFPRGALLLVVAQMDTAGTPPEDDPDGYRALLERKRAELLAALDRAPDDPDAPVIHLIAADPDQVGADDRPEPADYAGREEWDGVAQLRSDLRALAGRRDELRAAASVRYWCRMACRARTGAEDELRRVAEALAEARRTDALIDVNQQELRTLDAGARARLREGILAELLTLSAPGDDPLGQRAQLEGQLGGAIGRWWAEWSVRLDQFAQRVSVEHRTRAERPGTHHLRAYLDDLLETTAAPTQPAGAETDALLARFETHARSVARSGYQVLLGLSAEEARAELSHVRSLDPGQLERYFAGKEGLFTSAEHAELVRSRLQRLQMVEDLLPAAVELGSVVLTEIRDRREERRLAEKRETLRTHAGRIADDILRGDGTRAWAAAVASLRETLDGLRVPAHVVTRTEQRRRLLDSAVTMLTALLRRPGEAPGPDAGGGAVAPSGSE